MPRYKKIFKNILDLVAFRFEIKYGWLENLQITCVSAKSAFFAFLFILMIKDFLRDLLVTFWVRLVRDKGTNNNKIEKYQKILLIKQICKSFKGFSSHP